MSQHDSNHDGEGEQHTMITEAAERDDWEDKEAFGTIDGKKVYLVARLRNGIAPELVAMVGGEWYHYPDGMDDEYARHTRTERSFNSLSNLRVAFSALVDEHDLVEELPDEWKARTGTDQ